MNRRSVLLSTLTMIMLCVLSPPNELHAAGQGAGERVVLDKITLKSWPRWLAKVPPAATSLPHRWYVLDLYAWGCAKVNKSGTGLSPEAYIFSKEGQIAFTDDPENFRLTLFVKCASLPGVCFRYWHWKEKYRFDVMEGTLTKYAQGKERVLATASSPVFTEAERNGPKPWKLLEITAREGQFRIRLSGDGRKWRTIIQCVDRDLIEGGVISLEVIRQISRTPACFGDIEIASLGGGRGAAARAPGADELRRRLLPLAEYSKHCFSGGGNADARIEGFRLLDSLSPASARHPTIRLALASVLSEQMTRTKASRDAFRLHALRMVRKLKLKIDFAAELLRAVTHEDLGFQFGAIDALNRLKLKPEQLFSRAVDGLLLDDRFHRDNVGLLIHAGGEPLKKLVIKEIERRLAGATDKDQRKRLLRALFRDPLSLPVLLKALDDPAPEVRQMALHSLRFLDGPLAWKWERVKSVFSQAPEITKKITAKVQAMLQSDPSVACRAEAAGCLAQMRQAPKLLIAALADGESEVRAMAVQGLCNFRPQELAPAIGELERLKDDPRCGRDAAATLEYARSEDPKVENPEETFDVTKLTPEQLLAETSRRGRLAARKTLELDAEKLPWYLDVMSHMSALLCLGRNRDATDELLKRSISYYAYGKKGSLTQARLAAVYALHNSRSRSHPGGRFSAETEALYKKSMFSYVDWNSLRFDGFVNEVEALQGTENQTLNYGFGTWYPFLGFLKDDPEYAGRTLRGGKTVAEYYREWNAFVKAWLRYRALNGMWMELGANYLGNYTMPAVFGFYLAAPDPEVRRLSRMLIDLTLIDDAQCSFGYVRGGSKSRIKTQGIYGSLTRLSKFFYGGQVLSGRSSHAISMCGYEAPAVAVLLHNREQFPPEPIEIINRRLGETRNPDKRNFLNRDSRMLNYIYKTRNYMLGSTLRARDINVQAGFSQAQWNGLVFFNGTGLYPVSRGHGFSYYSFQHRNVWILDRIKDRGDLEFFVDPADGKVEKDGWVFINNQDRAYVALRAVKKTTAYRWEKRATQRSRAPAGKIWGGTFVVMKETDCPALVHAGDVDEYGSFDGFMSAVRRNTFELRDGAIRYSGPKQDRIEIFHDPKKLPRVNGRPLDVDRDMVYDSPFMKRRKGESIVTVRAGNRTAIYDFDKVSVETKIDSKQND